MRGVSVGPEPASFKFRVSPTFHRAFIMRSRNRGTLGPAMKKDIIITNTTIEHARHWFARFLDLAGWLIILGLIGAGLALGTGGGLFWLLFGGETVLALSLFGSAVLGVAGTLALLRRLELSARKLRAQPNRG